MIATCLLCEKEFVEQTQIGGAEVSVDEQFVKLTARLARHLVKKHNEQLKEVQESSVAYTSFVTLQYFESEDPYFAKSREELRGVIADDLDADIDPFYMGAVATCHYLNELMKIEPEPCETCIQVMLDGLITKFEISASEIKEYGEALKESEKEEKEGEEDVKKDEEESKAE